MYFPSKEVDMKSKAMFVLIWGLLYSAPASAQVAAGNPEYDTVATAIPGVIAAGAKIAFLDDGYQGTEGPIALPDGSVVFTETQRNRLMRVDQDGNGSRWLFNTTGANGLAFDSQGRLIAVQTIPGKTAVAVIYPAGKETVLSNNYDGKPYGRPNDLVVDKKGGVYFTDPGPNAEPGAPPAPLPPAVYYIPPGGKSMQVATDVTRPNGIQLSPDERTLYVNDSRGEYLIAYDIQPDGSLRNRRNFAKYVGVTRDGGQITSGADGLAVDNEGRVYTTSNAGIDVFSPQGMHLGTIPVSRRPQNLAFSGRDKKTLYIVGRGATFRVPMIAQGYLGRVK
jgi:sugar lactone lactonase YvrE